MLMFTGTAKLTTSRSRKAKAGGSGRGAVDEYNLLCDVLAILRRQTKEEGIVDLPGPTYKFLAKDIMAWNEGWKDDAFAGDRKAGWEEWLEKREREDEGEKGWEVVMR